MSHYSLAKVGTIFAGYQAYYPSIIDTSDLAGWPWTVTCFSSTDHAADGTVGIYMCGAVGDPTVPGNWENYNAALARGAFAAFGAKPAGNPIYTDSGTADSETPCVVRIGTTFYLTTHDDTGTSAGQATRLATAANYPLNFVRVPTDSGIVLNPGAAPLSSYPYTEKHTGYFRWGANVFPDVPYDYIGWSLFGGGSQNHFAQWGSDDGAAWTLLTLREQSPDIPGADTTYVNTWNCAEPKSARAVGGGEYVMLTALTTAAYGAATRYSEIYEITLSPDARQITREAVRIVARGGAGSNDEYEAAMPAVLEYGGEILCVYQGANSSGVNSLMLAVGTFSASAAKPAALEHRNFATERFVAAGASALPSWLQAEGGAVSFNAGGVRIPAGVGIRYASDLIPDTEQWVEMYIEQSGGAEEASIPILQIGSTGPGEATNGVLAVSYDSISDTQVRARSGGATVNSLNIGYGWKSNNQRKHRVGVQWDAVTDQVIFVGANRDRVRAISTSTAPAGSAVRPRFSAVNGYMDLEAIEVRRAVSTGGVAPTVTAGEFDESAVTLTLSALCLGDGTGLAVTVGGSPVAGTWSRTSLTDLVFARSAGAFSSGDTVAVTISNTDVRSVAHLVAIPDGSAGAITWGGAVIHELDGHAAASAAASGALTTAIPMAGAAVALSTAAATLTTGIPLAGSAAAVSIANGVLTTSIQLSGAAIAQATAAASLAGGVALSGTAVASASASGTLDTGIPLDGQAAAMAAALGSLTIEIRLAGAAVAQALAAADLTTAPQGLAGAAVAQASASGSLGTAIPLVGAAAAVASASGSLGVPVLLSGAAVAVSAATGDLTARITLEGHSLAAALAAGSLTTELRLQGAALAQAAASGALAGNTRTTPAFRTWAPEPRSRIYAPIGQAA